MKEVGRGTDAPDFNCVNTIRRNGEFLLGRRRGVRRINYCSDGPRDGR